ncbi:MAG: carboxypeptidase-like regulatory domain-containing protein [Acidobacteria bacterium]|nr:carboxypeptidase-like regulatory domain-containing protein [Acidobacteriota bacterium]
MSRGIRCVSILFLVFSLVLSSTPASLAQSAASGQGMTTASLEGRVFGPDRVTPVAGAVVRAVRGDGVQVYSSLPTDAKGNYSISHITLGSYDVVVEMPDGIYVVEKTLAISEAKPYGLSLATVPSENVEKRVPSIDKPVKGYAWTLEGKTAGGGFWKSPGGIAIIAGGAVALIALALSGDNDSNDDGSSGSPSTP